MERPKVPAMDGVEAVVKDLLEIEEVRRHLKEAERTRKSDLDKLVTEIAMQIKDREERIEAINYLYWRVPQINPAIIAKAFLGKPGIPKLMRMIKPIEMGFHCERCGGQLQFANRNKLKETQAKLRSKRNWYTWPKGYKLLCDTCRGEILAGREMEEDRWWAARKARLNELRRMPYREYLQTPEWHARRQRHFKSTGYRCQVCNASVKQKRLHVHHRKYTTIGAETFTDLIVLCEDCHELFHREGKLAEE